MPTYRETDDTAVRRARIYVDSRAVAPKGSGDIAIPLKKGAGWDFNGHAGELKVDQHYDVVFDNVQNHSFSERRRALTPNGICVLVGLGGAGWHEDTLTHLIRSFTTPLMSKFTSQKFGFFVAQLNHDDLAFFADLMQSGKVTPVIDKTYKSLGEVQDALEYLEGGHARGKVVIAVE